MQQPECPPKGNVLVLSNSFFAEWRPDIVEETFKDVAAAEAWIEAKLEDEPGDLYVIVSVTAMFWASIKIHRSARKKNV